MADNVGYTPGTGATVAADEIAGVLHQRVKIGVGTDGVAVDVSSSNPMPVSGTFYQATQPVSAASLPLPSGASTLAEQQSQTTLLGTIDTDTGSIASSASNIDGKMPTLVSGRVPVDGSGVTQPVSGTFWQATQPVSGTFFQATQPVSIASMPSTPVTGTFWQATQPVSGPLTDVQLRATPVEIDAALLPLPTGASTSALQTTGNTSLNSIDGKLPALVSSRVPVDGSGVTQPVSGPLTDTQLRASDVPVADAQSGNLLLRILQMLMAPLGYDKSLGRQRSTVIVETLPTLASVTTVTTLSNIGAIGGYSAQMQVFDTNRTSWAQCVRSRIS
jgi:hypothetical protein